MAELKKKKTLFKLKNSVTQPSKRRRRKYTAQLSANI